ncbi:hypothetical protein [Treponema putidum]|uniref:hypothetical protein n=1 Tax=Treponema putidum TaxID=221027 RepID=UPI002105676E|nr:hypothetical protein [Treponema putidum]UTY30506.1 hypothetical protein E4N75_02285 [Treponema putidum]
MTIDKVWCKECYTKLCKVFDKKYGKGNWNFSNLSSTAFFNYEKDEYLFTFYPPLLLIDKKVRRSKSGVKRIPYFPDFCPFCGKKIEPEYMED